jgi:hypothetical protein
MNTAIYWMTFSLSAIAFFTMLSYAAGALRRRTREPNEYCPYCLGVGYYHDAATNEDVFCECSDEYRIYHSNKGSRYRYDSEQLNDPRELRGSIAWLSTRGKGRR